MKDIKELSSEEQRVQSLEQMLEMTTSYMSQIEAELKEKKATLEEYNLQFTQSLDFASMIQRAIQPCEEDLTSVLSASFVLNKPRDVIGGDILWLRQQYGKIYIACLDCTGHGVPGALLSMMANFSLTNVLEASDYSDPGNLLHDFNKQFYNYLHIHQDSSKSITNGLDISLVIMDKAKRKVLFSGTRQSLVITTDVEVKVVKGSPAYIGEPKLNLEETTSIDIEKGMRFYLFSDGIVDQFGGPKNKKFLSKNLYDLLGKTHSLDMSEQRKKIVSSIENWMGTAEQTDDMLLVGFKVE